MNNRQFWFSIIFFVPHLYSAETMWVVLPGILAGKFNDLVFEDIPVLWYPVFFHCPVSGIDLLAGDKEHAFICPSCKLGIVGVPHVYGQDWRFGEIESPGNIDLMDITLCDCGKYWQINAEFAWYLDQPVPPESLSSIFDIGSVRGGFQDVSGIFWCSIGHEKMDIRFNQIIGHTCRPEPLVLFEGRGRAKKKHVSVDTPKFICYNTATHELEDFMLTEYRHDEQLRKILERRF